MARPIKGTILSITKQDYVDKKNNHYYNVTLAEWNRDGGIRGKYDMKVPAELTRSSHLKEGVVVGGWPKTDFETKEIIPGKFTLGTIAEHESGEELERADKGGLDLEMNDFWPPATLESDAPTKSNVVKPVDKAPKGNATATSNATTKSSYVNPNKGKFDYRLDREEELQRQEQLREQGVSSIGGTVMAAAISKGKEAKFEEYMDRIYAYAANKLGTTQNVVDTGMEEDDDPFATEDIPF